MILFFHVENGRVHWGIPVALFVLSSVVPTLIELILGPEIPDVTEQVRYHAAQQHLHSHGTSSRQRRDLPQHQQHGWLWEPLASLLGVILPAVIFFGVFTLLFEAQNRGWLRRLTRWLDSHVPGFPSLLALLRRLSDQLAALLGAEPARRVSRATYEQRFAKVTQAIQECATEVFMTREQLMALSSSRLKEIMKERGLEGHAAVEKVNLVDTILEAGGSTGESCNICLESYESGDLLRRLRCGHKFHIECVDKWALSSLDYSREPSCPACNTPLVEPKK
mmetsp:Transcript_30770/g.73271  ORF Transcript_30770/g.73271 Transcript_30770/m.73271 type:complete len:279 (-) Transcript_30770:258-1094(-)